MCGPKVALAVFHRGYQRQFGSSPYQVGEHFASFVPQSIEAKVAIVSLPNLIICRPNVKISFAFLPVSPGLGSRVVSVCLLCPSQFITRFPKFLRLLFLWEAANDIICPLMCALPTSQNRMGYEVCCALKVE